MSNLVMAVRERSMSLRKAYFLSRTARPLVIGLGIACFALAQAAVGAIAGEPSFVPLGLPGSPQSWIQSYSADGSSAIGYSYDFDNGVSRSFRADAQGTVDLGTLGGSDSYAAAISADGLTVVGQSQNSDSTHEAFIWTAQTGMVGLGTLGGHYSHAVAVSADGSTVAGSSATSSGQHEAFVWTAQMGMVPLGTLGGSYSNTMAISADGSTVVGQARKSDNSFETFIWTAQSGMIGLGALGGYNSWPQGISADGSTMIGQAYVNGTSQAFVWTADTGMIGLGTLTGNPSYAMALSADGSSVIGQAYSSGGYQAFVWTADTGMVGLGTLGGSYSSAAAISADGSTVIGHSSIADDLYQAFEWTAATGLVALESHGFHAWAQSMSSDRSRIVGGVWGELNAAVLWDEDRQIKLIADLLSEAGVETSGFSLVWADRISADGSTVFGYGWSSDGSFGPWAAVLPNNESPLAVAQLIIDGQAAGVDLDVDCHEDGTALVGISGSGSSDPDDDSLEYEWSVAQGSGIVIEDATAAETEGRFPLGVHEVTLTVYDLDASGNRKGAHSVAYLRITVVDQHPPIALVTTDVGVLWPVNNKMLPVEIRVTTTDACSSPNSLQILCTVTSSQADGTEDLAGDVNGHDGFSHPVPVELTSVGEGIFLGTVNLRAERDGQDKSGRVYSIHVEALDSSGNAGYASTSVVVPHSQAKK